MTLWVMIFKKFSLRVFWALFHPFSWLRFHQAYVCHLILCFIFIVLFFACPLAFLHSSCFLPSAGNSFNWVFYLSVLSPHSSVLGNSFFCSALKWICVFIIAVDCNIWKELRKNIQMVSGVCCSVVSVQGWTGEAVRATPAGLTWCSLSSPLLVVPSLGFFFFGIVNKGALRLLPPSEVWLLPTFSSTFLPLSWVDRSSGLLYCLLAWASFSSLIEPFLDISLSELPKDKTQHCEWCPLRLSRAAKASPWRTTSRALKNTHLGSTFQRSVLYSFGCSGSWLWHTGCSLRCASSLLAGAGFSLIVAHRLSGPVEYGIFVPNQGLHLHPLPLENRFLTTGPPGEFQVLHSKEDTQRVFRKALAWTAHD